MMWGTSDGALVCTTVTDAMEEAAATDDNRQALAARLQLLRTMLAQELRATTTRLSRVPPPTRLAASPPPESKGRECQSRRATASHLGSIKQYPTNTQQSGPLSKGKCSIAE
ncbi:unnamed protein product [Phytophthora lilii]|uniref:Unnamed protein product n=1 Tax=Phytophthora lilii TaxID=2077276 RepID=A0A9W6WRS9_9STRA|nr:unnamed protein product [Phytophthora lilii]